MFVYFTSVGIFLRSGAYLEILTLALLLTNCMCSQQDEGQESLEEELDVLVLDDEGNQVSYPPMVCPPVTPKMVLRKEVPMCLLFANHADLIRPETLV